MSFLIYLYKTIYLACNKGHFGTNCSRICSINCKPDPCRQTDASCTSCDAGWAGDNFTTGNYMLFNILQNSVMFSSYHVKAKVGLLSKKLFMTYITKVNNKFSSITFKTLYEFFDFRPMTSALRKSVKKVQDTWMNNYTMTNGFTKKKPSLERILVSHI